MAHSIWTIRYRPFLKYSTVIQYYSSEIYIYPLGPKDPQPSDIYSNILSSIESSVYSTKNSSEACLKILSLDTIDR